MQPDGSSSLGSIRNDGSPRGGCGHQRSSSMRASGGGRRVSSVEETVEGLRLALDLDEHCAGRVLDEAMQAQTGRQAVNIRAEADALHDTADRRSPGGPWHSPPGSDEPTGERLRPCNRSDCVS